MKTRSILIGIMLLPLTSAAALPAYAQTAPQTPAPAAQPAAAPAAKPAAVAKPKPVAARHSPALTEAANRKQFVALVADYQNHPEDALLRGKIVDLARIMNPAPAIPVVAQAAFEQATAQMNAAASAEDFKAVAEQFEQVAMLAPWFAEADYSAASAYAKAGDAEGLKRNLALYQAAVRPNAETHSAEDLKREYDRRQSDKFQAALQKFNAGPSDAGRIEIINLAQALITPPEISEDARGHYMMAAFLMKSAEGSLDDETHAIEEYQAALLGAPWWGEAYKKLAAAQEAAGQYNDASASLNIYQYTQPAAARENILSDIYRLKVLGEKATAQQEKSQAQAQQRKQLQEQKQKESEEIAARHYTVEGTWYDASAPSVYFSGGQAEPECDYQVKQSGARWTISSGCSRSKRTIDQVEVGVRQLTFRVTSRDAGFPYAEVEVTFGLSSDGKILEGRATAYDKNFLPVGDHPARWMRRE